MKQLFNWLRDEESGQGMVEYGLIIALIAVVVIVALTALGGNVKNIFNAAKEKLTVPAE
ncbi:MAG: Flp family type IVb pilin [Oscillospiraceae bacterium]|nr:Flp family type IVb pilin [Oscillospiraceae bacterium]